MTETPPQAGEHVQPLAVNEEWQWVAVMLIIAPAWLCLSRAL